MLFNICYVKNIYIMYKYSVWMVFVVLYVWLGMKFSFFYLLYRIIELLYYSFIRSWNSYMYYGIYNYFSFW